MDRAALQAINQARAARRAVAFVTELRSGRGFVEHEGGSGTSEPLKAAVYRAFQSGRSGMIEPSPGEAFLINVFLPPPRLVIIGAVHVSQALAPMATIAGLDVTIIDPRTAFASVERFPGVALLADWPDEALKERPLDAFTALAAVTHDPKIDDGPIVAALAAGAFYVGALGSRKTHAKRLERLGAAGVTAEAAARIRAPIGLAIGAHSPAEIAVSILAEVIAALRQRRVGGEDG